jgi:RNA polymerase sigma-70 factor (ECF subfamily)
MPTQISSVTSTLGGLCLFALDARLWSTGMSEDSRREVRTGLDRCLARLWRYALVLTRRSDTAEDLVQATCLRAVERADQFVPGTRLDRWLFAILRSIGLNEIRAQRISEGGGFIDAEDRLRTDGEKAVETNIPTSEMFKAIGPVARGRARNGLVGLWRGLQLRRSRKHAGNPDRYRDKPPRRGAFYASHAIVGLTYNVSLSPRQLHRKNLMNYPDLHRRSRVLDPAGAAE